MKNTSLEQSLDSLSLRDFLACGAALFNNKSTLRMCITLDVCMAHLRKRSGPILT